MIFYLTRKHIHSIKTNRIRTQEEQYTKSQPLDRTAPRSHPLDRPQSHGPTLTEFVVGPLERTDPYVPRRQTTWRRPRQLSAWRTQPCVAYVLDRWGEVRAQTAGKGRRDITVNEGSKRAKAQREVRLP